MTEERTAENRLVDFSDSSVISPRGCNILLVSPLISELNNVIGEFSKVAGYKINLQKSVAFLYTNNELSEREIKKRIPFAMTSKRMKYLEINLTKKLRDLYSENSKTSMKEVEDNTNKWKDILCS